jgi:hypothetical protein
MDVVLLHNYHVYQLYGTACIYKLDTSSETSAVAYYQTLQKSHTMLSFNFCFSMLLIINTLNAKRPLSVFLYFILH